MNTTEKELSAENALAGAILVDPRCMELLPDILKDTDFVSPVCRAVYTAAVNLAAEHSRIDPVVILHWCQTHSMPLNRQQVMELMTITPTAEGAADYAAMVHENALIRALTETVEAVKKESGVPLPDRIDRAVEMLRNIENQTEGNGEICCADVSYEPPRWLIEPYFQRGKGTMIQADPGTGKTAFMCAVAAAVTMGRGFLGLTVQTPGNVLMVSTEDDLGVLRGRIEASGGDLKKVFFLSDAAGLTMDSPRLRRSIQRLDIRMVVLDPLQAFLGAKVDMFRANETRPILASLFDMCQELDCACVIIAHLGKAAQGKSAVNQSLGSVDIPGAMRSILHIVRSPEDENELLAIHIKSSNAKNGKAIAYTIGDRGGVTFTGFRDISLKDVERAKREEPFSYEEEPLGEVISRLMEERGEGFISYEDISVMARKVLGFLPYTDTRDLAMKLRRPVFLQSLQKKDGIVMEVSVKKAGKRGVNLRRYRQPDGYQTSLKWTEKTERTENSVQRFRPSVFCHTEEMPWEACE